MSGDVSTIQGARENLNFQRSIFFQPVVTLVLLFLVCFLAKGIHCHYKEMTTEGRGMEEEEIVEREEDGREEEEEKEEEGKEEREKEGDES